MVVGVGNPLRGDDGAGLEVARQLRDRAGAGARVHEMEGEGIALLDLWEAPTRSCSSTPSGPAPPPARSTGSRSPTGRFPRACEARPRRTPSASGRRSSSRERSAGSRPDQSSTASRERASMRARRCPGTSLPPLFASRMRCWMRRAGSPRAPQVRRDPGNHGSANPFRRATRTPNPGGARLGGVRCGAILPVASGTARWRPPTRPIPRSRPRP